MPLGPFAAWLTTAEAEAAFGPGATIAAMLRFETALARAEAAEGVIPEAAVAPIAAAARAESYDPASLVAAARRAGTLAIPLVKALTQEVEKLDGEAAPYVHFGATSQDVLDTALVLMAREATAALLRDGRRLATSLRRLAFAHADTVMLGRTLLQPGPPITFGLKAAGWLSAVARGLERVAHAHRAASALQFGGAVGTLSALGVKGPAVAQRLAAELGLSCPEAPWHAQRDRMAALAAAVAILIGSAGKIARDVSLLMQAEVAEAAEPAGGGRGGSSTMPHKRNPMASAIALAAAQRAPGLLAGIVNGLSAQEHERAAGAWQAELASVPDLFALASGSLAAMAEAAEELTVDASAMARNMAATRGLPLAEALSLALAPKIGRGAAHALMERLAARAAASGEILLAVAAAEPEVTRHFDQDRLARLLDPGSYLGSAKLFLEQSVAAADAILDRLPE